MPAVNALSEPVAMGHFAGLLAYRGLEAVRSGSIVGFKLSALTNPANR